MLSARCHSSTSRVRSSVDDSRRSSKPDDYNKVARSKAGHNTRRSRGGRSIRRNRVESSRRNTETHALGPGRKLRENQRANREQKNQQLFHLAYTWGD